MRARWWIWTGALFVAVATHAAALSTLRLEADTRAPDLIEEYEVLMPPLGSLDAPIEEIAAEPLSHAPEPAPARPDVPEPPPPEPQPDPLPDVDPAPAPVAESVLLTPPAPERVTQETDSPRPVMTAKPEAASPGQTAPSPAEPVTRFGVASGVAEGQENFAGMLQAWFMKHKRYPHRARARRMQGVVQVWFRIDREGNLLEARVEKSSGHSVLDEATLDLLDRSSPFPPPPPILHETVLTVSVPIAYRLR